LPLSRQFWKWICRAACVSVQPATTARIRFSAELGHRPLAYRTGRHLSHLPSSRRLRSHPRPSPITNTLHRKDIIVISSCCPDSSIPRRSRPVRTQQFVSQSETLIARHRRACELIHHSPHHSSHGVNELYESRYLGHPEDQH